MKNNENRLNSNKYKGRSRQNRVIRKIKRKDSRFVKKTVREIRK